VLLRNFLNNDEGVFMHDKYNTLTNEEYFRLRGALTPERICKLLDIEANEEKLNIVGVNLSEALSPVGKDVLEPTKTLLNELREDAPKKYHAIVTHIISVVEEIQEEINRNVEYSDSIIKGCM
jgi:hypothetical protein